MIKMDDILMHYGVLGMKWGVRHDYEPVGRKVRGRDWKQELKTEKSERSTPLSEMTSQYKSKYKERLKELKKEYSVGWNGKLSVDDLSDLTSYMATMQAYMDPISDGEPTATNARVGLDANFMESCKMMGVNLETETSGKYSIQMAGLKLLELQRASFGNFSKEEYQRLLDESLSYVAAYDAMMSMPNTYYLPSEQEKIEEYNAQIAAKDELQKQANEMVKAAEKAGLGGLDPPIEVRMVDNTSYGKGLAYVVYLDGKPNYFSKDQLKEVQKFALKNDLFFKDYRTTKRGTRTREKNVDTSGGAKKVTKRQSIDISAKERSKKESTSKKALEESAKNLSDAIQAARNSRTQKEREEMKKAYEQFIKRTEGYTENKSLIDKLKDEYEKVKKRLSHMEGGSNVNENDDILMHYGVLGMKWGIRRYQNEDGTLTEAGKERVRKKYSKGANKLVKYDSKVQSWNLTKNRLDEEIRKQDYKANRPKRFLETWKGYEKRMDKAGLKLKSLENAYRKADWKAEKEYNKGAKWAEKMRTRFSDIDLSSVDKEEIKYVEAYISSVMEDRRRASHNSKRRSSGLSSRQWR